MTYKLWGLLPTHIMLLCKSKHTNTHTYTHPYLHYEYTCGIVCQLQCLFIRNSDLEWSKVLGPSLWPVLLALYLVPLFQVGDHHDGGRFLLPHQTPEVHHCLGQGTWTESHTTHSHNHHISLYLEWQWICSWSCSPGMSHEWGDEWGKGWIW